MNAGATISAIAESLPGGCLMQLVGQEGERVVVRFLRRGAGDLVVAAALLAEPLHGAANAGRRLPARARQPVDRDLVARDEPAPISAGEQVAERGAPSMHA